MISKFLKYIMKLKKDDLINYIMILGYILVYYIFLSIIIIKTFFLYYKNELTKNYIFFYLKSRFLFLFYFLKFCLII